MLTGAGQGADGALSSTCEPAQAHGRAKQAASPLHGSLPSKGQTIAMHFLSITQPRYSTCEEVSILESGRLSVFSLITIMMLAFSSAFCLFLLQLQLPPELRFVEVSYSNFRFCCLSVFFLPFLLCYDGAILWEYFFSQKKMVKKRLQGFILFVCFYPRKLYSTICICRLYSS